MSTPPVLNPPGVAAAELGGDASDRRVRRGAAGPITLHECGAGW